MTELGEKKKKKKKLCVQPRGDLVRSFVAMVQGRGF